MAYLESLTIDGTTSIVKEYKGGTGIEVTADGVINATGSSTVSWDEVTNKPTDLVRDPNYVHTDNNFTSTEKTKLAGLSNYDDTAVRNSISALQTNKQDKLTAGTNITISGNVISANVPQITVDGALSNTSENPVQNKVIKTKVDTIENNVATNANSISDLDTRVQALEDGGECYDYLLDGSYEGGRLNLSLTDGTTPQSLSIPIDSGFTTQGDWRYKINPDNTFEAFYYKSGVSLTIQDNSGNFYRSALQTLNLPTGITSAYDATPLHASVNTSHNNYPCLGTLASVTTNQLKYYALSGSSRGASPNYIVTAHVFGTLAAKA